MVSDGGWVVLIVVFATSLGLGAAAAHALVRWAANRTLWVFAVPFTLWWLVAGLSVAVYVFGVRVEFPAKERPAAGGPLTPRSEVEVEGM